MNAVVQESPRARILEVSEDEYFNDPCAVPSLSQSMAHKLIAESPLHAYTFHPRLGGEKRASTAATDDGHLIHKLLLGKGAEIEILPYDSFRTKDAQTARDYAIEMCRVPILAHKYREIEDIAGTLRLRISALGYSFSGQSEVAFEWQEESENGDVTCRARMDHILFDSGLIIDVKKTRDAHPKKCGRHMIDYGYDIQHAAYTRCLSKYLNGASTDMVFLFMEMEPPYCVVDARPDGVMRQLGESKWLRAVHTWQKCLKQNNWPGYGRNVVLEAPPWALNEEVAADW